MPWKEQMLVSVDGSPLDILGWTEVMLQIGSKKLSTKVIVVSEHPDSLNHCNWLFPIEQLWCGISRETCSSFVSPRRSFLLLKSMVALYWLRTSIPSMASVVSTSLFGGHGGGNSGRRSKPADMAGGRNHKQMISCGCC